MILILVKQILQMFLLAQLAFKKDGVGAFATTFSNPGFFGIPLIVAACPVGSNVAVYAQLHGKDYPYAVETVVISTILSILTIPLMMYLSSLLWR